MSVVQAATLDLHDAAVRDIVNDASCPAPTSGRSVRFGLPPFITIDGQPGTNGFGRVDNVAIDTYETTALDAVGPLDIPPTKVKFTNNTVISGNPQVPTEQFAINIALGARAQVTGNAVRGAVCTIDLCGADPLTEFQSTGIGLSPAIAGTRVSDNHVSGADIGIYQLFAAPNCCAISSNILRKNRFFGIVIQDGDGTTRENTISGGQIGIGVAADAVDTTGVLRGDRISGTTVAPVREFECCGVTATAIVNGYGLPHGPRTESRPARGHTARDRLREMLRR